MAEGLTSITFVEDLGSTPATVNRRTGELYISKRMWQKMTPDQRLFMLLHEAGHVALNTTNEFEADNYAHEMFMKAGGSLKASVSALTEVLSGNNPEHFERAKKQLERALLEDQKNKKGMKPSYIITSNTHRRANPGYSVEQMADPEFVEFRGRWRRRKNPTPTAQAGGWVRNVMSSPAAKNRNAIAGSIFQSLANKQLEMQSFIGKKAAKRREKRQEARQERKMIKAESKAVKREAKAQKKINNSEANIILAEQGINGRAQLASGILGGMAKVAGAVGGSVVGAQAVKALPSLIGGGGTDQSETDIAITEGIAPTPSPLAQIATTTLPVLTGALSSKINAIDPLEQGTHLQNTAGNVNAINSNDGYNIRTKSPEDSDDEKEKEKNKTMLFVGIGAAAVVVILLLVFMKK